MAKVLVVDDELSIRELLKSALIKKGISVVTVPSCDQALFCITNEPFDVVLLDVKLGSDSGLVVLQKIKRLQARLPVVIYSGHVSVELEKEARQLGASEVLCKDIPVMQLVDQVSKFIAGKDSYLNGMSKKKEKSILIVDDESEIRSILISFFKKKGYSNIAEADNGQRAIELMREHKFSVALLDINMPGIDGISTLEKLLEINPKLGVVMVTGRGEDENIKKALALGAYGYVLKPFDLLYLELVVMSKLLIAQGINSEGGNHVT